MVPSCLGGLLTSPLAFLYGCRLQEVVMVRGKNDLVVRMILQAVVSVDECTNIFFGERGSEMFSIYNLRTLAQKVRQFVYDFSNITREQIFVVTTFGTRWIRKTRVDAQLGFCNFVLEISKPAVALRPILAALLRS
jgi:hypothetical protein